MFTNTKLNDSITYSTKHSLYILYGFFYWNCHFTSYSTYTWVLSMWLCRCCWFTSIYSRSLGHCLLSFPSIAGGLISSLWSFVFLFLYFAACRFMTSLMKSIFKSSCGVCLDWFLCIICLFSSVSGDLLLMSQFI